MARVKASKPVIVDRFFPLPALLFLAPLLFFPFKLWLGVHRSAFPLYVISTARRRCSPPRSRFAWPKTLSGPDTVALGNRFYPSTANASVFEALVFSSAYIYIIGTLRSPKVYLAGGDKARAG